MFNLKNILDAYASVKLQDLLVKISLIQPTIVPKPSQLPSLRPTLLPTFK